MNKVYLIESGNYYKIGFSNNLETRSSVYDTHNPDWKLIDYFVAPQYIEKEIHAKCRPFWHRNEWFRKSDEVLNIFLEFKNMKTFKLNRYSPYKNDNIIEFINTNLEFLTYPQKCIMYIIYNATRDVLFKCDEFRRNVAFSQEFTEDEYYKTFNELVDLNVVIQIGDMYKVKHEFYYDICTETINYFIKEIEYDLIPNRKCNEIEKYKQIINSLKLDTKTKDERIENICKS